ncbi:MAG: S1 RNA-binding domain-containing protein [bacterium]
MTEIKTDTTQSATDSKPRAPRRNTRSESGRDATMAGTDLKPGRREMEDSPKKTVDFMHEAHKDTVMGKKFADIINPPSPGDIVEGPVVSIDKRGVFVDLKPFGTGIIFGREYIAARDILRKVNIGDSIAAKVVDLRNEEGYIELSLKEAKQALIWGEAESAIKSKASFDVVVLEANKGGLIMGWQGIQGFLPASQLKADHYPRVEDGNKDRILEELKKLVGQKLSVVVIAAIPKEGKLIFSEKSPESGEKEKMIGQYGVSEEVEGTVTGAVDFGVFVKLQEGLEGLVHISELDWALVEDPRTLYKVGDKVKAKIIEIKDGKVSLSIKALKPNPWKEAEKKYKKDDVVTGVVIKFNKHGALASIEEGVAGLVHVSEFGSDAKLREKLELGKSYKFKINIFDAKDQKMALGFVDKK